MPKVLGTIYKKNGKKSFITGGAGYVGCRLVEYLLKKISNNCL